MSTYRLDPYSPAWEIDHHDVAFSPSGQMYALYGVRRYESRFDDRGGRRPENRPGDPADRNFRHLLITRYDTDGAPLATALCCEQRPDGTPSSVREATTFRVAVQLDGTVVVSAHADCTYLIDPSLSTMLAAHTMPMRLAFKEVVPGDPFAGTVAVTPSGRLLCTVTEYGVHGYGGSGTNLLALSDTPLTAATKPVLEAIASVDPRPVNQTEAHDLRPHVRYQGRPVGLEHRPEPGLADLVALTAEERRRYGNARLGRPVAMTDDLFVVPVLGRTFRSGSRGQPFAFALINDRGEVTGRLEGMDYWKDSPFTGYLFTVVTDPARGRAFHLNRYGLYAWSSDGHLHARISTDDKPFTALKHFRLLGCSPQGEPVLAHRKQNLLLRVPPPATLTDLAQTVEEALRAYGRERTSLKKAWSPVNWCWTHTPGDLHHL
ncbi:MAG TPA: hypothetical protein VHJ17_15805 [Thermomonospora sp.]|nr:hypothetical protein [Thermomonospora sp.]